MEIGMRKSRPAELVLGSVQLGLPYGAANRTGKPSHANALSLVRRAANAGVALDTARAYGDSEDRIGEALSAKKPVRTITKLSPLDELKPDAARQSVRAAVDDSIAQSLSALRRDRLDCLLLHRARHMTAFGGAIWDRLIERLEDGTILSLGVSVQSPAEALYALECRDVQHLQLPFNLLDWRWRAHGVVEKIVARPHITVHARSVFLQGILASDDVSVWPRIAGVDPGYVVELLAEEAERLGRQNIADLCVAFVRGQEWIDGLVIGMETEDQFNDNMRLFLRAPLAAHACAELERRLPRLPERLLDPAQWPRQ
jgi:aryl-alcohol dehydrogenase-like predicted oxidoreductase